MSDNIFKHWKDLAELRGVPFDMSNFSAAAEVKGRPIQQMKQWLTLSVAMIKDIQANKIENEFSKEIAELKKVLGDMK